MSEQAAREREGEEEGEEAASVMQRSETESQGRRSERRGNNTNTSTSQETNTRVATCDASLSVTKARALSYRLFVLGFFLLPWAWIVNAWLFKHHIQLRALTAMTRTHTTTAGNTNTPRDAIVSVYAMRSFVLGVMSVWIFVTWLIVVHTAGGGLREKVSLRQFAAEFRQI